MGKGRYLKAAERACARKSRFETRAAAEAFVARRYRAYRCVVCGGFHLTSGRGDTPEPDPTPPSPPKGPTFADLDWSAVLSPAPAKPSAVELCTAVPPSTPEALPLRRTAKVLGVPGRDGRALLLVEGRIVKSRPIPRDERSRVLSGEEVEVSCDDPPRVL